MSSYLLTPPGEWHRSDDSIGSTLSRSAPKRQLNPNGSTTISTADVISQLISNNVIPSQPNNVSLVSPSSVQDKPSPSKSNLIQSSSNGKLARIQQSGSTPVSLQYLNKYGLCIDFLSKYTVLSELGSGGFGFVVSAVRHSDGKEVAVKFIFKRKIPPFNWARDKDLGIVPMEVFLLKNLKHQSVVDYLDFYQDETFCYLVMEMHGSPWTRSDIGDVKTITADPTLSTSKSFIDQPLTFQKKASYSNGLISQTSVHGCTLTDSPSKIKSCLPGTTSRPAPLDIRQKSFPVLSNFVRRPSMDLFECIERNRCLSEDNAKRVFKQLVDCVAYLHSRGIIHRDIKDENIVVDESWNVKLIDFGSAGIEPKGNPNHLFDRFQGTIQYASPEILRGEKYRGRPADVWALGILLYTLLFGQAPFTSSHQVMNSSINVPKARVSNECQDLLEWLLEKDPRERPSIEQVMTHEWLQSSTPSSDIK